MTETADSVKRSLMEQLKAHNADIEVFSELVADYAELYDVCCELKEDIGSRGAVIAEPNCSGRMTTKCNPSIKELRDTNKSMLAILKQLGLDIETVRVASACDDEL